MRDISAEMSSYSSVQPTSSLFPLDSLTLTVKEQLRFAMSSFTSRQCELQGRILMLEKQVSELALVHFGEEEDHWEKKKTCAGSSGRLQLRLPPLTGNKLASSQQTWCR